MRRPLHLVLAAVVAALAAGPARAEPPLWLVRGPHATLVLFGSVHLLPAGLQWETRRLRAALKDARDVWFEVPLDPAAALAAAKIAESRGVLPAGQTLDAQLPQALRERLARITRTEGIAPEGLQRLRPWLAEISLSLAAYRRAGALQEDGVERRLSEELPASVQRRAFETPREQIEALSASPLTDQVASLAVTLTELETGDQAYYQVIQAWMAGDTVELRRRALDPLTGAAPGVYRAMVVERNRRWIQAIRARLAGSGEAVMVVGVGHLIGPDGLPAMLRAQGYAVEGP